MQVTDAAQTLTVVESGGFVGNIRRHQCTLAALGPAERETVTRLFAQQPPPTRETKGAVEAGPGALRDGRQVELTLHGPTRAPAARRVLQQPHLDAATWQLVQAVQALGRAGGNA